MMGPEYFTVGAYIVDGEILCPACGDKEGLPVNAQITEAELWNSFQDYATEGGLYCECGEELIAPEDPEESEEENEDNVEEE